MGRYMETFYPMPEEINRNGGVNWLDDGSLAVISFGEGLYRSADGGQTWKQEETEWFAGKNGVTESTLFLGAFAYALAKYNGQTEVLFGSVNNGRRDLKLKRTNRNAGAHAAGLCTDSGRRDGGGVSAKLQQDFSRP